MVPANVLRSRSRNVEGFFKAHDGRTVVASQVFLAYQVREALFRHARGSDSERESERVRVRERERGGQSEREPRLGLARCRMAAWLVAATARRDTARCQRGSPTGERRAQRCCRFTRRVLSSTSTTPPPHGAPRILLVGERAAPVPVAAVPVVALLCRSQLSSTHTRFTPPLGTTAETHVSCTRAYTRVHTHTHTRRASRRTTTDASTRRRRRRRRARTPRGGPQESRVPAP